ncbi:DDE-type integrase/transposase/recombinase [Proteus mirabilis]|uniref:DDE-type integrase/transposase/recombinase n=1 Tax=Proteus mirabilis TaxID=584 RepID=UPI0039B414E5
MKTTVDSKGKIIDFLLTVKQDTVILLLFFRKTISHHNNPEMMRFDKSDVNIAALNTLNAQKVKNDRIALLSD